jgi:hypothetical protein
MAASILAILAALAGGLGLLLTWYIKKKTSPEEEKKVQDENIDKAVANHDTDAINVFVHDSLQEPDKDSNNSK